MDMIHDIAIIGGGASATLLAHRLHVGHGRKALILDPSPTPALGLAYGTRCVRHLLNVPAGGMSGVAHDPDHFLAWLRREIDPGIAAESFVPRAIYGLYLQHMAYESQAQRLHRHIVSCRFEEGLFHLEPDHGPVIRAQQVVLALGHFAPARLKGIDDRAFSDPGYHHRVWENGTLERVGCHDHVLLIGSGLTAIDMVMQMQTMGHRGPITLLSRHGRQPERHVPGPVAPEPVICPGTNPDHAPLTTLSCFMRFRQALKQGVTWRMALDSLRPVTNTLWCALSEKERDVFRRHLQRRWDVARHRIAPRIADALDQARHAGRLHIASGNLTGIRPSPEGLEVLATHKQHTLSFLADHVLNCTGPNLRYRSVGSPLLDGLFAQGLIRPGEKGIGLATDADGRVTGQASDVLRPLYTLGPARLGTLFESIAIPEIRQQAHDLAACLTRPQNGDTLTGKRS